MHKLLVVTKYIDHILYFFLDQLSRKCELTVVVDQKSDWTAKLDGGQARLVHLTPRSKFDRRFQSDIEGLGAGKGWDLIQCFHGNAQLANIIRWSRRRVPIIGYRGRIGRLKFRENPMTLWNVRSPALSAVAANSSGGKIYLESFRFLKGRNVHVLPHGVNRQWIESQAREAYGLRSRLDIGADDLIVVGVAALRPVKRFDYVIHAAENLCDRPVHFVHVGEPNGWDEKASHLPNVHFLGHMNNPFPILAEGDVFAMTSHNEAFGRVNLEAMALGKPVIGSNTGGQLDIVEPGVTGQLFDTHSADDFVRLVSEYCDNRNTVASHGQNAIERLDRLFSTERMVERYLKVYDKFLDQTH